MKAETQLPPPDNKLNPVLNGFGGVCVCVSAEALSARRGGAQGGPQCVGNGWEMGHSILKGAG